MVYTFSLLCLLGSARGNCGWTVPSGVENVALQRQYHSCTTEQDTLCGLMHCQFDEPAYYRTWKLKSVILTEPYESTLPDTSGTCVSMAFDAGKYKLIKTSLNHFEHRALM